MRALKTALPGTLIGISTAAWIEKDDDRLLAYIGRWSVLPDYASVNLGEKNAPAVIERLHRSGIGIEAGLAHREDAKGLLTLGLNRLAFRLLVDVDEQEPTHANEILDEILAMLRTGDVPKPVLLHGANASALPPAAARCRIWILHADRARRCEVFTGWIRPPDRIPT
jgi:uncharacterized protein (DUF849 family)